MKPCGEGGGLEGRGQGSVGRWWKGGGCMMNSWDSCTSRCRGVLQGLDNLQRQGLDNLQGKWGLDGGCGKGATPLKGVGLWGGPCIAPSWDSWTSEYIDSTTCWGGEQAECIRRESALHVCVGRGGGRGVTVQVGGLDSQTFKLCWGGEL
jgi:hypothetical protein